jgi:hypothetical protein
MGRLYAPLSFWSTAASEGFRRRFAGSRHDKELHDLGAEGISKLLEQRDGRTFQPSLKTAHVASIDLSIGG